MKRARPALGAAVTVMTCAVLLVLAVAGAARADTTDPYFVFYADEGKEGKLHTSYPPAAGGFDGPCGLAVNGGQIYVSDHYRNAVDVFSVTHNYLTRLAPQATFQGPCQLAITPDGTLYVNYYHQGVVRYQPSPFPVTDKTNYSTGQVIDEGNATGVAVDPATGRVYVNRRTYIAVYDSTGAPVLDEGVPLRIGEGSLTDSYSLAVSNFSFTKGYVYVADAADRKLEVFDPATDLDQPIAEIDGTDTPPGSFVSLTDSAVAVDSSTGATYVVDNLQPEGYERPEAAVYGFDYTGGYDGRFKFNVVHSQPPGLAALGETVYVTSGNSLGAAVYAYRGTALSAAVFPAPEARVEGEESVAAPSTASVAIQSAAMPASAVPAGTGTAAPVEEAAATRSSAGPDRRKVRAGRKAKRHRKSHGGRRR
jgi:hypothetical protein